MPSHHAVTSPGFPKHSLCVETILILRAANYLSMDKMQELNEIVTMYLNYAARQARRHIPMTMADWASSWRQSLQFNDADILRGNGKVTAAIAKAFAESEFEQYRIFQDRLYQSDFDKLIAAAQEGEGK